MNKKLEVSEIDKLHLEIIRENVASFIKNCSSEYDAYNKVLLDIAPQIYEGAKAYFKKASVKTLDIDPNANADYTADICRQNNHIIEGELFDFILCTEVLEHTYNPFSAVDELYRVLKNNGYLFVSVPFNFRIHGPLPDCWRFTEHGLRYLFRNFQILKLEEKATEGRNLMPIHYTIIAKKEN